MGCKIQVFCLQQAFLSGGSTAPNVVSSKTGGVAFSGATHWKSILCLTALKGVVFCSFAQVFPALVGRNLKKVIRFTPEKAKVSTVGQGTPLWEKLVVFQVDNIYSWQITETHLHESKSTKTHRYEKRPAGEVMHVTLFVSCNQSWKDLWTFEQDPKFETRKVLSGNSKQLRSQMKQELKLSWRFAERKSLDLQGNLLYQRKLDGCWWKDQEGEFLLCKKNGRHPFRFPQRRENPLARALVFVFVNAHLHWADKN